MSLTDDLGLRIALCDLIEKLKRSEQKCSYLEQCRHELMKEVMRLRVHNEWLAANSSHHNPTAHHSNPNCGHNNSSINNNGFKLDKSFETNGSDSDAKDESWEQITVRLLQELRQDVQSAHKEMTSAEAPQRDRAVSETELANKLVVVKAEREAETDESKDQPKKNNSAFDSTPTDTSTTMDESMSGVRSALSCTLLQVKSDLNHVLQSLTQQNEKLNKLKAKQLRNYFKRQINLEHNFHQTSTPLKVDPKFSHENY